MLTSSSRSAGPAPAARCPRCGRRVAAADPGCAIHGRVEAHADDVEIVAAVDPPEVPGYGAMRSIGRGGFGDVYRAEHTGGGPAVAIKVARADRPHANADLRAEAVVLAAVGPPHVPSVHEQGTLADGRRFVVMELIEAPTLAARLAPGAGPVPFAEATALSLGILRALEAVHARGYVHRDLKPENILVDALARATLVDFGLVAGVDGLGSSSTSGDRGIPMGTAEYMAPEQCEGRADVDARADIYALGVILFELCAGRPPFWGPRAVVHESHRSRRPPRIAALADGRAVPPALEEVVARCLAKDRRDRYPDVRALGAALAEVARSLAAAPPAAPAGDAAAPSRRAARPEGDRLTVGLLFFEADADVATVQARVVALGGQLAHGGAGRFVAMFGQDLADNPARRALHAAEEMLRMRLCDRIRVDLAPVAVRPRRDGTNRFVSPLFVRGDRYPAPGDARGISLSAAALEVMPDAAGEPAGGPEVPVRATAPPEYASTPEIAAWPLIGRDAILDALVASARAAAFGPVPTLVSVVAGTGHGKSHLFRVLCKRLGELYLADVLDLRAGEPALGDVDHTLSELLRRALSLPATPPPEGGGELLRRRLGEGAELAPAVALALGWVNAGGAEGPSSVAPAEGPISNPSLSIALRAISAAPGALRASLTVAAGDALRRRAAARPLFVVLDDAHYASDVLLSALEYAALAEGGAPLWICALGRPALAEGRPQWGARAGRRERHELGPLDPESAAALCRRLLLPVESVADSVVERLVDRAEAVPLLLVELVRGLRRQGIVRKSPKGEAYYLATDELDLLPHLPLIEWLARGELDALAPALREHARLIALLGGPVITADVEGVIRRLEQSGAGLDLPLDARIGTERLLAAGIVIDDGHGRIGFRHELVRESIARATPEPVRRRIHLAAAAYYADLAATGAEEGRLAQLAAHGSAAGQSVIAGRAYLALAERARARHAYTEAERLYSRALEQSGVDRAVAYRGRALMRYRIGRYHDALADISCAREMVRSAGDLVAEVDLLLDEATAFDWMDEYQSSEERVREAERLLPGARRPPLVEARLLLGLGRSAHRFSRNEEAADHLARAAAAAEPLGEDAYETLVVALMLLGGILPTLGRIHEARRVLDRVLTLCEEHGDRLHLGAALNHSAMCWASLGDKARLVADMERSLALARQLGQETLEFLAELNLGDFLMLMDDTDAASAHIARAVAIDKKLSGDPVRPAVALVEARLRLQRGDHLGAAEMVARLRDRDAAARAEGHALLVPAEDIVCRMIELATSGAPASAWDDLESRSERVSMGQERIEIIEARAVAAEQRGDLDEARRHLQRALALSQEIANPMLARLGRRAKELC